MSKKKEQPKYAPMYPWTVLIKGIWWLCLAPVKTIGSAAEYFNIPVLNVLPGWHYKKAYPEDYPEDDKDYPDVYGDTFYGTKGAGFKKKDYRHKKKDDES